MKVLLVADSLAVTRMQGQVPQLAELIEEQLKVNVGFVSDGIDDLVQGQLESSASARFKRPEDVDLAILLTGHGLPDNLGAVTYDELSLVTTKLVSGTDMRVLAVVTLLELLRQARVRPCFNPGCVMQLGNGVGFDDLSQRLMCGRIACDTCLQQLR